MAGGRPSKFEDMKDILLKLAAKGFTDAQMADVIGVTEQTINNWKIAHPQFFESLKEWKIKADEEVERSLYEKAIGYSHSDTKFATHEGQITDSVEYTKHYAPDTTAAIFWLKNRQPDKWRDKTETEHSGEIKMPIIKITK